MPRIICVAFRECAHHVTRFPDKSNLVEPHRWLQHLLPSAKGKFDTHDEYRANNSCGTPSSTIRYVLVYPVDRNQPFPVLNAPAGAGTVLPRTT